MKAASKRLRAILEGEGEVKAEMRYYYSLPDPSDHKHHLTGKVNVTV